MPEFNCGACGKLLKTPAGSEGKQGRCPHCGGVMHIPNKPSAGGPAQRPAGTSNPAPGNPAPPQQKPTQQKPPAARPQQPAPQRPTAPRPTAPRPAPQQPKPQPQPNPFANSPGTPASNLSSNPYAAPAPQPGGFGHAGGRAPFRGSPHRGGLVLTLGLVSLITSLVTVVCCLCAGPLSIPLAIVGVACGIPASIMGFADLKQMKQQTMDPSGHGMTMSGVVTGMIGAILAGLSALASIVFTIIAIAAQA